MGGCVGDWIDGQVASISMGWGRYMDVDRWVDGWMVSREFADG